MSQQGTDVAGFIDGSRIGRGQQLILLGWALGVGRLGGVLGPLLVGGMFALQWDVSSVFYAAIVPAALGAVTVLYVSRSAVRSTVAPPIPTVQPIH
jgi:hypothetical protein